MTELLGAFARLAPLMVWAAVATAVTMAAAVVLERAEFGVQQALDRRLLQRYRPLVHRALEGDDTARDELLARSRETSDRDRLAGDRTAHRGSRPGAHRQGLARSCRRCRCSPSPTVTCGAGCGGGARAPCARSGSIQATDHTAQLVAALDDPHPDVRAAALDGLTDMHDLTALAGHRRAGARHVPAPRPARRGAQGVRIRLRAVSAGVVGGRSGKPPQLHPRPGHLWHGPVAARLVPLDSRHPRRGTRDGL